MGLPYTEEWDPNTAPWFHIVQDILASADITINGTRPFDIHVTTPNFFKRVLQEGSLELGESYMDGWWECGRLDMFFHRVIRAGLENTLPRRLHDLTQIALSRVTNLQSRRCARIVGKAYYDLGNDFFILMLDPYMQYSCAYWKQAQTLEQAQEAKLATAFHTLHGTLSPDVQLLS